MNAKVKYEEPNGSNGYYTKNPSITIEYDGRGRTKYRLKNANGRIWTGELNTQNKMITLQAEQLSEGANYLDVWIETEDGKIDESSIRQIKFSIDRTAPQYPLEFKEGKVLEVTAVDSGSGVAGIFYSIEGKETQYIKGNQAFITLPENFSGKVCAYAVDRAGNVGAYCYYEKKKTVVQRPVKKEPVEEAVEEGKDLKEPEILIEGIYNLHAIKEAKLITISVRDNVGIEAAKCLILKKDQEGEYTHELSEWEQAEDGLVLQYEVKEEGIYRFGIEARDKAGNTKAMSKQVLFDPNPPIVEWQKDLNQSSFQWKINEFIVVKDLTSCLYEVRVDGILFGENQVLRKTGKHRLQITVYDLTGNKKIENIDFYITKNMIK